MSLGDKEKLSRIEELKSKLFSRGYRTKVEHRDNFPHFHEKEVMSDWKDKTDVHPNQEKDFFMKSSLFKKMFLSSLVFFFLALAYASFMFFGNNNTVSNDNIDIAIKSNAFTDGGEDYSLIVEIVNKNNSALDLVDLVIEYPKSSITSSLEDNEHLRMSIGTIPSGGIKNENIKLVLFGEQGSTRQIKISLEYRVEGSNAIFIKDKLFEVSINSTPIDLSIDAPTSISANQDFNLNIKSTLNATKPISKILLKVDYPIGFQFIKSNPMPSLGNNIWNLGDMNPGSFRNVSITGRMIDVTDGEDKIFRFWSGAQSSNDKSSISTLFNSLEHTTTIQKSSVEAKLLINNQSSREYAVDTNTGIEGQIKWKNNLDTKINNLEIRAKISGNAVDRKKISANQGFYNSSEDTIVWDKNSIKSFVEVSPGEEGSVSFSLSSLPLFGGSSGILSFPSINIDVTITGKQADRGNSSIELSNKESKIIRIISNLGLSSKAIYYSGPFKNTGPIPPKAEQKTTYTITWSVSNTANNISKAEVKSSIPSWVRFVGSIIPATEDVTYNDQTREIIWSVGGIPKGTGLTDTDRAVSFQLELSPSLSQVNTSPLLLNESVLTGHDDFANVDVRAKKGSLDIRLLNDFGSPANAGRVIE